MNWILGKQSKLLSDTYVSHALRQTQSTSEYMKTRWIKFRIQNRDLKGTTRLYKFTRTILPSLLVNYPLFSFRSWFAFPNILNLPLPLSSFTCCPSLLLPLSTPAHNNLILPFSTDCSNWEYSSYKMSSDWHGNTFILPKLLNENKGWPPHVSLMQNISLNWGLFWTESGYRTGIFKVLFHLLSFIPDTIAANWSRIWRVKTYFGTWHSLGNIHLLVLMKG